MKLLLIISLLFLQNASVENQIQEIRKHYKYVEDNLPSFNIEREETYDQSTDGSTILKYFDNKDLVKIRVEYLGETGKLYQEYFIKNESLLFVYEQEFKCNMPYYIDEKAANEMGFEEGYNPHKIQKSENRYYFSNKKMIRWIDAEGKPHPDSNSDWLTKQKEIVSEFHELIK